MADFNWTDLAGSEPHGSQFRACVVMSGVGDDDWLHTPAGPKYPGRQGCFAMRNAGIDGTVVHAKMINRAGFSPTVRDDVCTGGGRIQAAIRRGNGQPSDRGAQPILFLNLAAPDVTALGYLLGIDDDGHVALNKGRLIDGVGAGPTCLMRSADPVEPGAWVHLQLGCRANPNEETVIRVMRNGFTSPATFATPTWAFIPGMLGRFVDDCLAANSGSLPFIGGYMGFAGRFTEMGRLAFFDQIETARETQAPPS